VLGIELGKLLGTTDGEILSDGKLLGTALGIWVGSILGKELGF